MTIVKSYEELVAECDVCGESQELGLHENDGFGLAISQMQNDGWLIRKRHTEWEHVCPDCVALEKKAEFGEIEDDD
jgi:hypothetical protein